MINSKSNVKVTLSERKNLMWRDKLVEGIFFIRELKKQNSFVFIYRVQKSYKLWAPEDPLTWGESLNMGVQTIRGVEWCLAARASVCVPLTALNPPLARTVCVPMMTWGESDNHTGWPPHSDTTVSKSLVVSQTLLTRDMTANMAASAITVVSMLALERLVAISWPWWKANSRKEIIIFYCASCKNM